MERHHRLFEAMDEVGLGYACRGIIRYLESAIGESCCPDRIEQPADTMMEEQLLDHKLVADLHAAVDAGAPIDQVKVIEREVINEISRTVAKYIKDLEG